MVRLAKEDVERIITKLYPVVFVTSNCGGACWRTSFALQEQGSATTSVTGDPMRWKKSQQGVIAPSFHLVRRSLRFK